MQTVYFHLQISVYYSEKSELELKQEHAKETMEELCLAGSLSCITVL